MKKSVLSLFCCIMLITLNAQDSTKIVYPVNPKKKPVIDLSGRANDHLMFQFGWAGWAGKPDSINTKGFPKSVNLYFMFDFPVKTNQKISIGIGAGFGSDHIYFDKMYLGIKDLTTTLTIDDRSDTAYFDKYKLAVSYLEAPLEFRYTQNPMQSNKSFKAAIGMKVGTITNAHTRGKDYVGAAGGTNEYIQKELSKRFINKTRFVATGRVGYGIFSVFGSYQISQLFKDGLAPEVHPWAIGLQISGL